LPERDLPGDAVERFFALGFALGRLRRDFRDSLAEKSPRLGTMSV
jgi:hypothetical protein